MRSGNVWELLEGKEMVELGVFITKLVEIFSGTG
jgi:hypothetical protein